MYGMQGSSLTSNIGITEGFGSLHGQVNQQQQQQQLQQQLQRFRSGSHSQPDHHHSLPIQNGVSTNVVTTMISQGHSSSTGGARSSHPHGYPPHLMNTPTSSFPPSPQFSSPHMHPLPGGGGGMSFPTGTNALSLFYQYTLIVLSIFYQCTIIVLSIFYQYTLRDLQ